MNSRRILSRAALAGLVAAGVFAIACAVLPVFEHRASGCFGPGYDFRLRMNEIRCLARGVDPYDVWSEKTILEPYVPCHSAKCEYDPAKHYEPINAYVPWEYSVMAPLAALPVRVAWGVYKAITILCGVLFWFGLRRTAEEEGLDRDGATMAASVALGIVAYPAWSDATVGNLALVAATAMFFAVRFASKGRDVLAGLCWCAAMMKPQMALLLAVPFLLRRKILLCTVAAGTSLVLSVPAALIVEKPLWTMLMEAMSASECAFNGCGTCPSFMLSFMPRGACIATGLALGFAVCAWATWRLRRVASWQTFAMPAIAMGALWTYTQSYSFVLGFSLAFSTAVYVLRRERPGAAGWFAAAAGVLLLPQPAAMVDALAICATGSVFFDSSVSALIRTLNSAATVVFLMVFAGLLREDATSGEYRTR